MSVNNPVEHIILPSLDKEIEQAHIGWQKAHPIELEVKKPKKERKKKAKEPKEVTTDKNITIHNEKNKTIETIFKASQPFQIKNLPPINYTNWVKQWFEDPNQAIIDQGYTDINSKKYTLPHLYWRPIALHSFSARTDEYLLQWATVTKIPNRKNPNREDWLVTLPGMIEYSNGDKETGVFAYLIDTSNGQWYHRMFEPQTGKKLITDLFKKGYFSPEMEGYYDIFFPPLGKK